MSNPGCGCRTCERDPAAFWPPAYNQTRPLQLIASVFDQEDSLFFYWSFMWHCARSDGWGEWFYYGDEMV